MAGWTPDDIADLSGITAVVTGANSGLGLCTTLELARHGAHVVMACRSAERGEAAVQTVLADVPDASIELQALDLADLDSVRAFADGLSHDSIDRLFNNAGVMALPYTLTKQGFEMQIGVNHLGHFALTGLLLDRLSRSEAARVVNISSQAHRMGWIQLDDLQSKNRYQRWMAYGQSKLANLLFTYETARRLAVSHPNILSVAAHPGYSNTHLQTQGARMEQSALKQWFMATSNNLFAQSAEGGAMPSLYAGTHPEVESGGYYGPSGPGEWYGPPKKVSSNARSHDEAVAAELWERSEELTGVRWPTT